MSSTSSPSYSGIFLSSNSASNLIYSDQSPVGTGYGEIGAGTLTTGPVGGYTNPIGVNTGQIVLLEIVIIVASSSLIMFSGNVNNIPAYSGGNPSSGGVFKATTVDLTTAFSIYAVGATVADVLSCSYAFSITA